MSPQHLPGWLIWACRSAVLGLALLVGAGCDLASPTKGPDYEKGYAYGVMTAQRYSQMGQRWTSGPAPSQRGKSKEWTRGYEEGWRVTVQSAK